MGVNGRLAQNFVFLKSSICLYLYFQIQNAQNKALLMQLETSTATPTETELAPEVVGVDEAEYALQKFEALKLLNDDYANATFDEARQLFEEIKNENGDIPASVSFEYALINDLLLPAREKRDLAEKAKRLFTSVYTNCSHLSSWMRKIYPFCSDRHKRSTFFGNLTKIDTIRRLPLSKIDTIRRLPLRLPKCHPRAHAQVLNPTPNDYKISPGPLIFMAVASSLGLLSSLVLICKAFCCKN
jgi:hypothetical protein